MVATYKLVQEWVKQQYDCTSETCWITHAQRAQSQGAECVEVNDCPDEPLRTLKEKDIKQ
jgi:hypothetical protein